MSRPSTVRRLGPALLALCLLTPAGAAEEASAPASIARGNDLYRGGDYDAAQLAYEAAAQAMPDAPLVRFNLGDVAYKTLDYLAAERLFNEALQTRDTHLMSRARYNLGNVKYQLSLYAMQTFRDAIGPLRAAMAYYREALALDPEFEDALYNLELAHRFMRQLQDQNVQPQANPRVRNQKPSENKGQAFEDEATKDRPAEDDAKPDRQQPPQGRQAQQAPKSDSPAQTGAQSDQTMGPQQAMSQEEAQQLVDVTRERAQAAQEQRQQARRARVRDPSIERIW
jgi:tetratricopeptide (TPR) repeat protein